MMSSTIEAIHDTISWAVGYITRVTLYGALCAFPGRHGLSRKIWPPARAIMYILVLFIKVE